uniref:Uncharacterized protein n=1 Tax=Thermosphaera aggregans TaxID=54254 RepID=A0A7C2BLX7_9CREN
MESSSQFDTYITCEKDCSLRYIEALAMIGLLEKAEVVECEEQRFRKIRGVVVTGRVVETKCFLDEEVNQSLRIINIYLGFARSNKAKEKLAVVESGTSGNEAL